MLSPEYLAHVAEKIRNEAEELEDEILFIVLLFLLAEDKKSVIHTVPTLSARINSVVASYRATGNAIIRKTIENTIAQTERDSVAFESASMTTYEKELVRHWEKVSQDTWYNLTQTQAYEAVNTYVREVDEAARKVMQGEAHDKVWKDTARRLGEGGMPITTADGRTEQVSTCVERNLRTAVSRMSGDLELESAKRNGFTTVLVSAHLGARPTHEVWQGKVYSLTGKTEQYDDFYTATGYGTMLGLCGINCRHSFSPWMKGMPNPYENFDNEESRKRWEIEQRQRALERRVRQWKRRVKEAEAECKAFPEDEECKKHLHETRRKWSDARQDYRFFCKVHDLRPLEERLKA